MRALTSRVILVAGIAGLLGITVPGTSSAASLTITLESPTVTLAAAVFNVRLTFEGDPGDLISAVQISVVGSDPALTAGGTDYSRFSFQLNNVTVPDWSELAPINPATGFNLSAPDDPLNGPFIGPTTGLLFGTLTVDLSGIDAYTPLFVTLAGGTAGLDATDVAGVVNGDAVDSFAAAGLLNVLPTQVRFESVPEPAQSAWRSSR